MTIELTQADRDAANKAFDIAFQGDTTTIDDDMAELFARHRLERSEPVAEIERLRDKFASILEVELSESYDCTRVWSAWGYGTMGEDDFAPVINRIDEIANELATAALGDAS